MTEQQAIDALAAIDLKHATYPACVVCDQRVIKLDRFGACSKTTEVHREHRADLERSER